MFLSALQKAVIRSFQNYAAYEGEVVHTNYKLIELNFGPFQLMLEESGLLLHMERENLNRIPSVSSIVVDLNAVSAFVVCTPEDCNSISLRSCTDQAEVAHTLLVDWFVPSGLCRRTTYEY